MMFITAFTDAVLRQETQRKGRCSMKKTLQEPEIEETKETAKVEEVSEEK